MKELYTFNAETIRVKVNRQPRLRALFGLWLMWLSFRLFRTAYAIMGIEFVADDDGTPERNT